MHHGCEVETPPASNRGLVATSRHGALPRIEDQAARVTIHDHFAQLLRQGLSEHETRKTANGWQNPPMELAAGLIVAGVGSASGVGIVPLAVAAWQGHIGRAARNLAVSLLFFGLGIWISGPASPWWRPYELISSWHRGVFAAGLLAGVMTGATWTIHHHRPSRTTAGLLTAAVAFTVVVSYAAADYVVGLE